MERRMKKIGHLSQLVLYSKGWFKKTNEIEDLKVLIADAFLLPIETMTAECVRNAMLTAVQELGLVNEDNFYRFMESISPEDFYKYTDDWTVTQMRKPHLKYDFSYAVIRTCMSMMCTLKMCDNKGKQIRILRKPNFELLPPAREPNGIDDHEWDEDDK
jgi:hypothetical protein